MAVDLCGEASDVREWRAVWVIWGCPQPGYKHPWGLRAVRARHGGGSCCYNMQIECGNSR